MSPRDFESRSDEFLRGGACGAAFCDGMLGGVVSGLTMAGRPVLSSGVSRPHA
jgi:hypothetical protein